jgi:hypothetical protein
MLRAPNATNQCPSSSQNPEKILYRTLVGIYLIALAVIELGGFHAFFLLIMATSLAWCTFQL